MKLSVIVPVYNVEKYLDKCLNSLVNQKMDDYEIIIVNDGTKDNSQIIIDKYVENYPILVKSYIKENGGLSDARNFGLKYATGEYISFFDSDDYVDNDYYCSMYNLAKKDDLDLVVADLEYVWENNEKKSMIKDGLNLGANKNIEKALFLSPLSVCNKLFRKDLFTQLNLKFYEGLWYEDIPVALIYCANAKKVGYCRQSRYHYLQRSTSIMGSGYSPKMYDIFTIFERVLNEFKNKGLYDRYYDELEYLSIEHFLVYGAFRFLRTEHYDELMTKAFSFVKDEFPNYRRNKYISTLGKKNELFLYTNSTKTMSFWHWYLTRNYMPGKTYDSLVFSSPFATIRTYEKKYDLDLSVIVPVYNVEKYLGKCLDSLVNQTMKNYEVIVVNDGTKDNSQSIIDEYVNKYPNIIRPFIKKNGGLSDARNFGLQHARGRYICFLDSDDYVEKDFYKGMYDIANKNDLDLVVSDLEYVWEYGEKSPMRKDGLVLGREDANKLLFLSPLFSWNKLYRHELFEQLECKYPVGLWYEDIPVTLRFFSDARNIGYYHHVGVHYLQRSSSIMSSPYSDKMYDIFTIFENVISEFKEKGLYDSYKDELEYLYVEHFLVYGAFRFLRTEHYDELMTKAFSFVKDEFPNYRRNKYISTLGKKNELFLYTNSTKTMSFWHWYLTR